jgi:hypothetical protein
MRTLPLHCMYTHVPANVRVCIQPVNVRVCSACSYEEEVDVPQSQPRRFEHRQIMKTCRQWMTNFFLLLCNIYFRAVLSPVLPKCTTLCPDLRHQVFFLFFFSFGGWYVHRCFIFALQCSLLLRHVHPRRKRRPRRQVGRADHRRKVRLHF